MPHRTLLALAMLLALLALAGSAHASGRTVIDDCTEDEILKRTYTQQEYRDALAKLPADADQYGNCRDIIARAQDAAATKGAAKRGSKKPGVVAPAGGGTPTPPAPSVQPAKEQLAAATPQERAAVRDAARDAPDDEAGPADPIAAERVGSAPRAGASDLPLPILVLLAVLLAGALALGAVRVRSLVHTRRA
ncbi:MAG TPA: hypothetical protein VGO80_18070 [Solirubrobacteraceae bacterium]|nr:hypothetical protein [Solirubrobacteraceae bacterium]